MAFNNDNLHIANKLATEILQDSKSSDIAKQEAAVLFVITCVMNNDRQLNEKSDYVIKVLKMTQLPADSATYTLLEYPTSMKIAPDKLLEIMSYSKTGSALAHFMIIMRYLYYGCKWEKMLNALTQAQRAMRMANHTSWVYKILNQRLANYSKMIKTRHLNMRLKPEPVLIAFIKRLNPQPSQSKKSTSSTKPASERINAK